MTPDLEQQLPLLIQQLRTEDGAERASALAALNAIVATELKQNLRRLIEQLRSRDAAVCADALEALRALGRAGRPAILLVLALLANQDEAVSFKAFQCLGEMAPEVLEQSARLSSSEREDRLAGIREIATLVPAVRNALANRRPGWRVVKRLLDEASTPKPPASLARGSVTEDTMSKPTEVANPDATPKPAPSTPWEVGFPSEVPLAGRWVAWDQRRRQIIAVADTYPELMKQVPNPDDPDVVVRTAPGIHPVAAARPFTLLSDESPDVLEDVKNVIGDEHERWLETPHWWFEGRRPRDVVGTEEEKQLRYLLRQIRYGIPT